MGTMLEKIRRMLDQSTDPPVARLIGFKLSEVDKGRAVIRLQSGPQHANPMGTLHGGILCDIADAAMGIAWSTLLDEAESFTTLELKINFFRPVWNAELTAEARVIHGGRTIGLLDARVTDEKGRLIAFATSTCMTLRGESAANRTILVAEG